MRHAIILASVVLADRNIPTHDREVFGYAVAGVVLLVVGCVLTIVANARQAARPPRAGGPAPTADDGKQSDLVARLQRDVRRWTKRA